MDVSFGKFSARLLSKKKSPAGEYATDFDQKAGFQD
jgi:hypothetical protein